MSVLVLWSIAKDIVNMIGYRNFHDTEFYFDDACIPNKSGYILSKQNFLIKILRLNGRHMHIAYGGMGSFVYYEDMTESSHFINTRHLTAEQQDRQASVKVCAPNYP